MVQFPHGEKYYLLTWDDPEDAGYYVKIDPKEIPALLKRLKPLGPAVEFIDIDSRTVTDLDDLIEGLLE